MSRMASPKQAKEKETHKYQDHAFDKEDGTISQASLVDSSTKEAAAPQNERNFPVKLHYMLSELEKDGMDHIVSWQPHGRCFLVHEKDEFVKKILPFWFRQSKFASFQRQLNHYGFKRLTTGEDRNAYYHELFLRGKRFLTKRIQRIKIKGTGTRKPSSPETEPNFYKLPYLSLKEEHEIGKDACNVPNLTFREAINPNLVQMNDVMNMRNALALPFNNLGTDSQLIPIANQSSIGRMSLSSNAWPATGFASLHRDLDLRVQWPPPIPSMQLREERGVPVLLAEQMASLSPALRPRHTGLHSQAYIAQNVLQDDALRLAHASRPQGTQALQGVQQLGNFSQSIMQEMLRRRSFQGLLP